jgi:hypothetical protein
MDETTRTHLAALSTGDKHTQDAAYTFLMAATEQPVDWAYEAWDEVVLALGSPDNRVRAIASQLLCQLAAHSDPDGRILTDFPALLNVTRDDRFVTARHCLQSLWKVGTAGAAQQAVVIDGLTRRYHEAAAEKNGTLIRYDIQVDLRNLYDATGDDAIKPAAEALIDLEEDPKYRRKYAGAWKK